MKLIELKYWFCREDEKRYPSDGFTLTFVNGGSCRVDTEDSADNAIFRQWRSPSELADTLRWMADEIETFKDGEMK